MVYYKGKYHLFYQYYDSPNWGPMHWAHATSTDLIHWKEQPIQFYPDEYGTMYSGCAVIANHKTAQQYLMKVKKDLYSLLLLMVVMVVMFKKLLQHIVKMAKLSINMMKEKS